MLIAPERSRDSSLSIRWVLNMRSASTSSA
jgi:hypothetical protein